MTVNGYGYFLGERLMKCSKIDYNNGCTTQSILKTIEFHTSNM